MAVLPVEMPLRYSEFLPNTASTGRHGSSREGTYSEPPVTRYAYQVYPLSWRSPKPDPVDVETYDRAEADMLLDVPDPTIYKKRDLVEINGITYEVQGLPNSADWSHGTSLFSSYDDMFGGTVHLRRVVT